MPETALGLRFKVVIDGMDFGNWHKCDGLSVEYDIEEYEEGGENGYVHRLPGRVKYDSVKLTRPIDEHSARVTLWVASQQLMLKPGAAAISVLDAGGETVAQWALVGVFPVRWSGPSLDVDGNQMATETLEVAHNGFLGPF
ncbi:phage tail protein [soil metagenome]